MQINLPQLSKLPEIGRAFGRTLTEFKSAAQDLTKDDDEDKKDKQAFEIYARSGEENVKRVN